MIALQNNDNSSEWSRVGLRHGVRGRATKLFYHFNDSNMQALKVVYSRLLFYSATYHFFCGLWYLSCSL